ncbi:MAG: calcium-binding protein [Rhodobacteraceae bacterium]|nr:calcium-binding protein [Paracoccaceae bacterium]
MATTIISTNQTTVQNLSTDDELILLDGVTMTNTSGAAIDTTAQSVTDLDVIIAGDIFTNTHGILLAGDTNSDGSGEGRHSLQITATGSVGVLSGYGVFSQGSGNVITNNGEIFSLDTSSSGIRNVGADFVLTNNGTINGEAGVRLDNSGTQVSDASIQNNGVIQGIDYGINAFEVALNLVNTGLISATNESGSADGVSAFDSIGLIGAVIINTGTISGQDDSIILGVGDNTVINSGQLIGHVNFGSGNDTFDGRGGTVLGVVSGGGGDDTYIVDDATLVLSELIFGGTDDVQSVVDWTLGYNFENLTLIGSGNVDGYGNGESNTITGNSGDNVLNGLGSADTLYGNAGDDKLNGGNGIDNLFGGDGDDRLRGQKGADILKSEAGNDTISGGEGNDNLFGGDDNDILKGGMGRDKLYGGDDADVFLYTKAAQSKNDATSDTIKDFELDIDTIDLSGVSAGTLVFIGSAAFSGTQGEVQVTVNGGGTSTVLVDADGDGLADMKITVAGVSGLLADEFVL